MGRIVTPWAASSAGERLPHTQEVVGSNPTPPTTRGIRPLWPVRPVVGRGILALLALLLLALTFRPIIEGDGVGYYAYLHAVLVSHSLDLTNEYAAAIASHTPVYLPLVTTRTSTGHLADFFPVGPAILSAPAYLIALGLRGSGEPQYGSPFVEAFTLASLLCGLIALAICYRLASSIVVGRRAALIGVLGASFATPQVYYLVTDPSYSHTFSIFCVSAFLYAWWKGPPRTYRGWFGLGLLGGLMAMTRFQDGLLVGIVLIDLKRLRWPALALLPGMLVAFAPQLAMDQVQYGAWLPQRPPGQPLDVLHGNYFNVLFASNRGLFVWTPAALVAAAGYLFVQDRRFKLACALAFLVEVVIEGSVGDLGGSAFGARRLLDLLPFAVVGLAAVAERIGPKFGWAVVGVLSIWNLVLIANFEYVMNNGSQDRGYGGLLLGQMAALPDIPRLFGKGAVVRDLLLWGQAHIRFDPVGGVALLVLEAACLAAAVAVATHRPRMAATAGATGDSEGGC